MPEGTAITLQRLLQECIDTFYFDIRNPERIRNNFKAFVYALQFCQEDKIVLAFRTWLIRGKKYPVPADIVEIIQKGSFEKSLMPSSAHNWPEWKKAIAEKHGEAVVKNIFNNTKRNDNTLSVPSPTIRRIIEQNYKKDLEQLGITQITT